MHIIKYRRIHEEDHIEDMTAIHRQGAACRRTGMASQILKLTSLTRRKKARRRSTAWHARGER